MSKYAHKHGLFCDFNAPLINWERWTSDGSVDGFPEKQALLLLHNFVKQSISKTRWFDSQTRKRIEDPATICRPDSGIYVSKLRNHVLMQRKIRKRDQKKFRNTVSKKTGHLSMWHKLKRPRISTEMPNTTHLLK